MAPGLPDAECQPSDRSPANDFVQRLPIPKLTTPDGRQCAVPLSACPPGAGCVGPANLIAPDRPLGLPADGRVSIDFGVAVDSTSRTLQKRSQCGIKMSTTADPRVWRLEVEEIEGSCPAGTVVDGSISASYSYSADRAAGFEGTFGVSLRR